MKHELLHAFSAVIVTGTGNLLDRIPTVWKAVGALVAAMLLGSAATTVYIEQRGLPARMVNVEKDQARDSAYFDGRLDALSLRVDGNATNNRTLNLLVMRVICRQDGGTADYCDLKYGGGLSVLE